MANEHESVAGGKHGVVIGLMDGSRICGHMDKFTPALSRLVVEVDGESTLHRLNPDEVAYIGFESQGDLREGKRKIPRMAGMEAVRVHTVTGETFEGFIMATSEHPAGMHAFVGDESSKFEHIFFYHHGVRLRERLQSIGKVLVDENIVSGEQIHHALSRQKEERSTPIGRIIVEEKMVSENKVDEALSVQQHRCKRLGEVLIEEGVLSEEDLEHALAEQKHRRGKKIGEILVELGVLDEAELVSALALKFHLSFVNLDEYPIDVSALAEVNETILRKYGVLPVQADERAITLAISDPLNTEAYDAVRMHTEKRIREVLAVPSQLRKHLEKAFGDDESGDDDDWLIVEAGAMQGESESEPEALDEARGAEETPIIRMVNKIIREGVRKRATDIHILPQPKNWTLGYRINGDLIIEREMEKAVLPKVVSRLKILCGMDISEHRLPQDGHLQLHYKCHTVEFRVSCIPNACGESIVMRILDKDVAKRITDLGFREQDLNRLIRMSRRPFGLILVTGPTGSGKSTTLFSILASLTAFPLHLISIEDPVESEIPGVNQVQVHSKIGMTFARVLRNILRHDPDVIMVGEMRDKETAQIGIEAALTGHLMFSTLHTNSAADTIIRLMDMGIPRYLLAPALLGVISQMLVKRLCPDCRQRVPENDDIFHVIRDMGWEAPAHLYQAEGCDACHGTGYVDRVILYEFMEVGDVVRQAIHSGIIGGELQQVAEKEGMRSRARHAYELAGQGVIAKDELLRALL